MEPKTRPTPTASIHVAQANTTAIRKSAAVIKKFWRLLRLSSIVGSAPETSTLAGPRWTTLTTVRKTTADALIQNVPHKNPEGRASTVLPMPAIKPGMPASVAMAMPMPALKLGVVLSRVVRSDTTSRSKAHVMPVAATINSGAIQATNHSPPDASAGPLVPPAKG